MMKVPHGIKKTAAMTVLRSGHAFLLLKRHNEPNSGMYVPVGGKLEPFETPRNAAIRETYEETGIRIPSPRFGGVLIESAPTAYNWQSYIFIAEIEWMRPPVCDEGVLTWISSEEIPGIPTPPTDWMIYQYLLRETPFVFSAEYDEKLNLLAMYEELEGKQVL